MKELFELQQRLVATKTNWNEFSNFSYRSLEDILMKAKPLLNELRCVIKLTDEMVMLGERFYVKSTATLQNENGEKETAIGWAREPIEIKGMSAPQVTGTASSYARKYALASLLAIDDNKDIDSMDNRTNYKPSNTTNEKPAAPIQTKQTNEEKLKQYLLENKTEENEEQLKKFYLYYIKKVNDWKGDFNVEQLANKWLEKAN